ncbi:guanylate cyclase 32E-like [Penaeus chinensis]|uniref:guanylate cyclase 32E-like n=1 Tax=Penaeus chinensis TaxID=139456 RepID=UPI001FB5D2B8|nr:guanylate cyclase 32E-like [Penaeus chinensis]
MTTKYGIEISAEKNKVIVIAKEDVKLNYPITVPNKCLEQSTWVKRQGETKKELDDRHQGMSKLLCGSCYRDRTVSSQERLFIIAQVGNRNPEWMILLTWDRDQDSHPHAWRLSLVFEAERVVTVLSSPEVVVEARKRLWTAPELLRRGATLPRGTQKGDVFSFGIILYEVMGRKGPWGDYMDKFTVQGTWVGFCAAYILSKLRECCEPPLRPPLDTLKAPEYVHRCLRECWVEEPDERPDFKLIQMRLKEMQAGLKLNIVDNMLAMMEKYAYNLEGKVQERTKQLMEEKKKTEILLLRMLPKSVAESLKRGEKVHPESYDNVTIYFSDIVGFTSLSATSTPLQMVDMLNDLYTCFDAIIGDYDVYKVETIGDAYMVVSGLPICNGDRHAGEIASMALKLLDAARTFTIRHRPSDTLKLRIGIHSGPCVAGVVGLTMPRYCLFGDTVNTASRMESTGEQLRIHISHANKLMLDKIGGYLVEKRGLTYVKGKGQMMTWWLVGVQTPGREEPGRRPSQPSHADAHARRRASPELRPHAHLQLPALVSCSKCCRFVRVSLQPLSCGVWHAPSCGHPLGL